MCNSVSAKSSNQAFVDQFNAADKNGDGRLYQDELGLLNNLDGVDQNGDAEVELWEYLKFASENGDAEAAAEAESEGAPKSEEAAGPEEVCECSGEGVNDPVEEHGDGNGDQDGSEKGCEESDGLTSQEQSFAVLNNTDNNWAEVDLIASPGLERAGMSEGDADALVAAYDADADGDGRLYIGLHPDTGEQIQVEGSAYLNGGGSDHVDTLMAGYAEDQD